MSIELVIPSNHLILCCSLLLPSIFPSIKVFYNELALHIRWPKYWSFSFSISPSYEYIGLISFRIVWSLCSPRDSQESSRVRRFKSINSLALSLLYGPALTSVHNYWKNHRLPFPTPGDLHDPGIKPASLGSPTLAGWFFSISAIWETQIHSNILSSKCHCLLAVKQPEELGNLQISVVFTVFPVSGLW